MTRNKKKRVPPWLDEDKHGNLHFNPAAKVVVRIFELARDGVGVNAIAAILDEEKVPMLPSDWGRAGDAMWEGKQIARLLRDEDVCGKVEPYLPALISPELFKHVRDGLDARDERGRGRNGDDVTNLFAGLAHCAFCAGKLRYRVVRGEAVLACRDTGCKAPLHQYSSLEKLIVLVLFASGLPLAAPRNAVADPLNELPLRSLITLERATSALEVLGRDDLDDHLRDIHEGRFSRASKELDRLQEIVDGYVLKPDNSASLQRFDTLKLAVEFMNGHGIDTRLKVRECLLRMITKMMFAETEEFGDSIIIEGPIVQLSREYKAQFRGWIKQGSDFILIAVPT